MGPSAPVNGMVAVTRFRAIRGQVTGGPASRIHHCPGASRDHGHRHPLGADPLVPGRPHRRLDAQVSPPQDRPPAGSLGVNALTRPGTHRRAGRVGAITATAQVSAASRVTRRTRRLRCSAGRRASTDRRLRRCALCAQGTAGSAYSSPPTPTRSGAPNLEVGLVGERPSDGRLLTASARPWSGRGARGGSGRLGGHAAGRPASPPCQPRVDPPAATRPAPGKGGMRRRGEHTEAADDERQCGEGEQRFTVALPLVPA